MKPRPTTRLRPRERLLNASQFQRVFQKGSRFDGPLFLLVALENEQGYTRVGLAASRKLGEAVERNRAKRLLRECFRRNKLEAALDIVLVPKPAMAGQSVREVEREYQNRLRRLAGRLSPRRAGPRAPNRD